MKVTIPERMKSIITLAELPSVESIIKDCEEYDIVDYAKQVARLICKDNIVEVLHCNAEIAKNCRVSDAWCSTSGDLDVWITFTASCGMIALGGFIMVGIYLTDIWNIRADGSNRDEIMSHAYIRKFVEAEEKKA